MVLHNGYTNLALVAFPQPAAWATCTRQKRKTLGGNGYRHCSSSRQIMIFCKTFSPRRDQNIIWLALRSSDRWQFQLGQLSRNVYLTRVWRWLACASAISASTWYSAPSPPPPVQSPLPRERQASRGRGW